MRRVHLVGGMLVKVSLTAVTLASAMLVAGKGSALLVVNESASLPKGVYLRRPGAEIGRGSVVVLAQPPEVKAYLRGLGMPPEVLLIKRVAATGGERVCRRQADVATPMRSVAALGRDGRGYELPAWTGCRLLAADEVFLLGDTAASFDSRYFGPVRRSQLSGVYRELVTW